MHALCLTRLTPPAAPAPTLPATSELETEGWPDACSDEDVKFIRSASVNGYDVWIWSCKTSEEGDVYVHASCRNGSSIYLTTRWQSVNAMSPEEYLEWDYAIQAWPPLRRE
jgi:hypothetical protein